MDIAIIGSGISGLSAAWGLRQDHRVRIFERDLRPGGHVKTVTVPTSDGPVNVDTGFIVYNEPTYPRLTALFAELGIETQPTEMSLGHTCQACGLEFGSRQPASMFAQPSALARPSHWLMINDIRRFYSIARGRLDSDTWTRQTLAEFLDEGRFDDLDRGDDDRGAAARRRGSRRSAARGRRRSCLPGDLVAGRTRGGGHARQHVGRRHRSAGGTHHVEAGAGRGEARRYDGPS